MPKTRQVPCLLRFVGELPGHQQLVRTALGYVSKYAVRKWANTFRISLALVVSNLVQQRLQLR